ncbi:FtsW/RodA/SpoVE family cell cycle protein [Listeria aquatica]|uniref:Probable peptidoglycan glycosyltransferase FtsW n=1 Tax=Listeria aquatica TaxID=1494960 RepID=A0A841ZKD7_9LIST|nr:FtsW/RodA/SpoVE family cell cycle protein [Listeria aquatica]MBC1520666.1 FtsW/RodA/SpoVE family cell cycle protein [Listeria aquatica]
MLKRILKSYDYSLIVVYILLCLFGLVMVYSASWSLAYRHELPADFYYVRQVKNLCISLVFFIGFALFPYHVFQKNKFLIPMMFGSVLLLLMIFFVGHAANNAQSWFRLGAASLQPGEFVKISVIIYLAAIYAKKQSYIDDFNRGVLPPVFFLAFVCFLIAIQPDLGTAMIIFLTGCCIILCSGMRLKSMLKLIGLGIGILVVLTLIVLLLPDHIQSQIISPTRLGRFTGFMNPFRDQGTTGHQLVNSYYAIGSGGFFGQGLGQSVQKLGYLPEAHTDFIIAVISEELGVFGVLFVLFGLFFIIFKTIVTGLRTDNPFGSLICYGTAGLIGIQAFINLGGASGTIPITGVTLPFISYGGSSLMVLSILMGIVLNIGMFSNYKRKYGKQE